MSHRPSHWRILACDLDGTLIGWDHKINERDMEALRRARAAGIHVAICTGRNSRECAGIIGALGLEGLGVFVNGATVCDMGTGLIVDAQIIADALVDEMVDFFGARGHGVLVLADDPVTRWPRYLMTTHGPPHNATTDWLLVNHVHSEQVDEIPEEIRGRIMRLGVVVNVPEAAPLHADVRRQFASRLASHSIYSPHYDCQIIEVFREGVDKWSGMRHLAGVMQVDAQRILAIGDDINDAALLQNAALSFAMGDAAPAIQAMAKRLTAPHKDCGLARVIDDLLAGRLEP